MTAMPSTDPAVRRAHYLRNKARIIAQVQAWKAANPDRVKANKRAHYLRNREKYIALAKASYERRKAAASTNPSHA